MHPLDHPIAGSLAGEHSRFARVLGNVARFDPEVAPFLRHPDRLQDQDWADIAALFGPGEIVGLRGEGHVFPSGWEIVERLDLLQLDGSALHTRSLPTAVRLGSEDVPEMLDLVARTQPGPFLPRTVELGTYLGIREGGVLIAMAGERLHPPGWTEISAVCTDPAHRGRGLASDLIRAVGHGIRDRGEIPFLGAETTNVRAVRLYLSMGFVVRAKYKLTLVRTPGVCTS